MPTRSIYDMLTGQTVDQATLANLDSATGRSFLDSKSIEFWSGVITIQKILEASRTYPHGLGIPEDSKVNATADATSGSTQPAGTEIFMVQAVSFTNNSAGTATITLSIDTGGASAAVQTITVAAGASGSMVIYFPIEINNTNYLSWSSDEQVLSFTAYNVVSK
jgi:hypothetical protein